MNYIKRLEMENAALRADRAAALDACNCLARYLTLPKFRTDTTVQVGDVFLRLETIRSWLLQGFAR